MPASFRYESTLIPPTETSLVMVDDSCNAPFESINAAAPIRTFESIAKSTNEFLIADSFSSAFNSCPFNDTEDIKRDSKKKPLRQDANVQACASVLKYVYITAPLFIRFHGD